MTDSKTGILIEPMVIIPIGMDCRILSQRDPLYKSFFGHALKKRWDDLSKDGEL